MNENQNLEAQENETCPAVGYQAVTVSVPVTVKPFAQAGATVTRCCGMPIVKSGKTAGEGVKNGICNFTLGQNLLVAIPVAFGAQATVGDAYVDCIGASAEDIDCDKLGELINSNQPEDVEPTPAPPAPTPAAPEEVSK